jgi:signal transduction histidine kinase
MKEKFLKITVKDTGVGIKESDQDKLFKLFGFVQNT